jgi:hypothetical protein
MVRHAVLLNFELIGHRATGSHAAIRKSWQIFDKTVSGQSRENLNSENRRVFTCDLWWAWVDLNHRPRPYRGTTVRSHNDLQDLQEPRGLPKYLQVVQDVVELP